MNAQAVTLHFPLQLYDRLKRHADETQRSVEDEILDGTKDTLLIELPKKGQAQILLLRVTDSAFNAITFDLSRELP